LTVLKINEESGGNRMKILMVNKFLYPNGGSETYCFKLAEYLKKMGHDVQFFGMEHERNIVGNNLDINVSNVDFKEISFSKLLYPFKIIYSLEAATKIRRIIESYRPDLVHLNNFNFQLTPSILYEIKKNRIPVVMTLHDFQLICPSRMMYVEHEKKECEACKGGRYYNCISNNCIHHSRIKSVLAALEGWLYYTLKTYENGIDCFIAPSSFLKNKFVEHGYPEEMIRVLTNFIVPDTGKKYGSKKRYVLYFGRLSAQKGMRTLIETCKQLPEVRFVVAGTGEMEDELKTIDNIEFEGFKTGEELIRLISEAAFSVYPSEWSENCPLSVLESQVYGTPVIGSNVGGIPELIDHHVDGLLFEAGNARDFAEKIKYLHQNPEVLKQFSIRCSAKAVNFTIERYYEKLMKIYQTAIRKKEKEICQEEDAYMVRL